MFDFTIQRPSGTQRIDARDGVVIIEGLHALNPALTEALPEDAALCLYAGLREEYADSRDARCLATRDIRLARRLVRDCLFRGHGAAFTLGLVGPRLRGRGPATSSPTSPAPISCWTPPTPTRSACGVPVLDAMPADQALTATQRTPIGTPCGKNLRRSRRLDTDLVPGKQHAAGVYRQIILHNSRKIYICALQTAPQSAIIDLNRTDRTAATGLKKEVLNYV